MKPEIIFFVSSCIFSIVMRKTKVQSINFSNSKFKIRRALRSERSIICGIHCANHLAASVRNENELNFQIADLPTDFPHLFSDEIFNKSICFVATVDDEIVGCINLVQEFSQDRLNDKIFELNSFSVDANHRNMGIGKSLLKTALLYACKEEADEVKLLTLQNVMLAAVKLYRHFGFEDYKEGVGGDYHLLYMSINKVKLAKIFCIK